MAVPLRGESLLGTLTQLDSDALSGRRVQLSVLEGHPSVQRYDLGIHLLLSWVSRLYHMLLSYYLRSVAARCCHGTRSSPRGHLRLARGGVRKSGLGVHASGV